MKNQIDAGLTVNYTNATGADIKAGAVVPMGLLCGIAIVDIDNGASGEVSLSGTYRLAKKTATDAILQGDILVADSGPKKISAGTTIVDAVVIGRAMAASNSATTTVDVKLGL